MPLPDPEPTIVEAPASAGIGLRFRYKERTAMPSWPADYWQRNIDTQFYDPDGPAPLPLTERMMRIPGFPYPVTP